MIKVFMRQITLIALLVQSSISALVLETKNISDVLKYVDKDSIVVFDIDNTLTKVSPDIEPWVHHKTAELQKKGLEFREALQFVLAMYFLLTEFTKLVPIGGSPEVVGKLQKQGLPVIALTNRSIPVAKRTIERLQKNNIDLTKNTLSEKDLDISGKFKGLYSKGIIFTGGNDKGKMLFVFFKKIGYNPKKIVFINDRPRNVKSVQKAAKEHNVDFVGMRITFMDQAKKDFNMKKAEEIIHQMKVKLAFDPIELPVKTCPARKCCCCSLLTSIWNGITWPFKKVWSWFQ